MHNDPRSDRAMLDALGISSKGISRSPWLHLLSAVLTLAGSKGELLHHMEKPWASATFSGTRHTLALCFDGAEAVTAGEDFIAALPDHEFTIARQLVADATVSSVEHTTLPAPRMVVEVALLLLEDY